jgi:hypothetical protein
MNYNFYSNKAYFGRNITAVALMWFVLSDLPQVKKSEDLAVRQKDPKFSIRFCGSFETEKYCNVREFWD